MKDGQTARKETGKGSDRAKMRVRNGQRHGREEKAEQKKNDETRNEPNGTEISGDWRKTRRQNGRTKLKRRASTSQRKGKTGKNGWETSKPRGGRWGSNMLADHNNKINRIK